MRVPFSSYPSQNTIVNSSTTVYHTLLRYSIVTGSTVVELQAYSLAYIIHSKQNVAPTELLLVRL